MKEQPIFMYLLDNNSNTIFFVFTFFMPCILEESDKQKICLLSVYLEFP